MRIPLVLVALGMVLLAKPAAADPGAPWTPGPQASGDDTYTGFVDGPQAGATVSAVARLEIRGWAVDNTAEGWAGIDQVQVVLGVLDQGGHVLATGTVGQDRPDVAAAMGNPFFAASGFSALVPAGALPLGQDVLSVYIHTPGKGWWYRQVTVQVQAQALPLSHRRSAMTRSLVVEAPLADARIVPNTANLPVRGFAIDRNAAQGMGVGGSGVRRIQVYLDGGKRDGTFLGEAQLGVKSRDATGWGERFETAGWETDHPSQRDGRGPAHPVHLRHLGGLGCRNAGHRPVPHHGALASTQQTLAREQAARPPHYADIEQPEQGSHVQQRRATDQEQESRRRDEQQDDR